MRKNERIGGAALIVAAAGIMLGMAHHPTHLSAGLLNQWVHGILLAFLALNTFGFACFVLARGPARPAILAGAVCYGFALFGHIGAGTINGFAVPALARHGEAIGRDVFQFAWEVNQALAAFGVVAASAAILFWSADFLGRRGVEARAIGAFGLVAGGAPALLLLGGVTNMHVAGALFAYASHAVWGAAVGVHLLRQKASDAA